LWFLSQCARLKLYNDLYNQLAGNQLMMVTLMCALVIYQKQEVARHRGGMTFPCCHAIEMYIKLLNKQQKLLQ